MQPLFWAGGRTYAEDKAHHQSQFFLSRKIFLNGVFLSMGHSGWLRHRKNPSRLLPCKRFCRPFFSPPKWCAGVCRFCCQGMNGFAPFFAPFPHQFFPSKTCFQECHSIRCSQGRCRLFRQTCPARYKAVYILGVCSTCGNQSGI